MQQKEIILANPRGFCAGVERAINIVEKSLEYYDSDVTVRHEIVHNRFVVDGLKQKGATFVEEISQAPVGKPVIISAHGAPARVTKEAEQNNSMLIDATCPLVSKVHQEVRKRHKKGYHIILIGHSGHPEIEGILGQLPKNAASLIENIEDLEKFNPSHEKLAYATQTTLSVDDVKDIVAKLKSKFPNIEGPKIEDICYATSNRQDAVKQIANKCDILLVLGANNSSNSIRLVEVAKAKGCKQACLIESAKDIQWEQIEKANVIGISAGASAPEALVQETVAEIKIRFPATVNEWQGKKENIKFKLPKELS